MANEKVDVVIVGAGASGSVYASVLAKAGKKVVLLEAGPDWQMSDLISSEMWGVDRRDAFVEGRPVRPPARPAGAWQRGPALFRQPSALLPNDYKMKSSITAGSISRSRMRLPRSTTGARDIGGGRRQAEAGAAAGNLSDAADEGLPSAIWLKGFGRSASAWCRRRWRELDRLRGGRPAICDGCCMSAVASARQPGGHVLGGPERPGRGARALHRDVL
jgi:choline dehydrogenase-like flavoprotein